MRRAVVLVTGPPASGKTTLIRICSKLTTDKSISCSTVNISCLHMINYAFWCSLARLLGRNNMLKWASRHKVHPIIVSPAVVASSLKNITYILEIFSKALVMLLKVLPKLFSTEILFVDDGPAIAWANYTQMWQRGLLTRRQILRLMYLDIIFILLLKRITDRLLVVFLDAKDSNILKRWYERIGNKDASKLAYASLVREKWKVFHRILEDCSPNENFLIAEVDNSNDMLRLTNYILKTVTTRKQMADDMV